MWWKRTWHRSIEAELDYLFFILFWDNELHLIPPNSDNVCTGIYSAWEVTFKCDPNRLSGSQRKQWEWPKGWIILVPLTAVVLHHRWGCHRAANHGWCGTEHCEMSRDFFLMCDILPPRNQVWAPCSPSWGLPLLINRCFRNQKKEKTLLTWVWEL